MIVTLVGDKYEGYWISPDLDWVSHPKIDVTDKFYARYQAYAAEQEFIQSKLHRYYTEAQEKQKQEAYNKMPKREAKGFD